MNREDLLENCFNIEMVGNQTDGYSDVYRRINPNLITDNKKTEFEYIMNILIPTWIHTDKSLMKLKSVEWIPNEMCICSQEIADICHFTHPNLVKPLQIGIKCVEKIDALLAKKAKTLLNKLKKDKKDKAAKEAKEKQDAIKAEEDRAIKAIKDAEQLRIEEQIRVEQIRVRLIRFEAERKRKEKMCVKCGVEEKYQEWATMCLSCFHGPKKRLTL